MAEAAAYAPEGGVLQLSCMASAFPLSSAIRLPCQGRVSDFYSTGPCLIPAPVSSIAACGLVVSHLEQCACVESAINHTFIYIYFMTHGSIPSRCDLLNVSICSTSPNDSFPSGLERNPTQISPPMRRV